VWFLGFGDVTFGSLCVLVAFFLWAFCWSLFKAPVYSSLLCTLLGTQKLLPHDSASVPFYLAKNYAVNPSGHSGRKKPPYSDNGVSWCFKFQGQRDSPLALVPVRPSPPSQLKHKLFDLVLDLLSGSPT